MTEEQWNILHNFLECILEKLKDIEYELAKEPDLNGIKQQHDIRDIETGD